MWRFVALAAFLAALGAWAGSCAPSAQLDTPSAVPLVLNTWPFTNATAAAWDVLQSSGSALDAVTEGCTACEELQCDFTVGWGGSPDEDGETTLDALVMDGDSMYAGAVAGLRRIRQATRTARLVMEHTRHTLLAGDLATQFAVQMGLQESSLSSPRSLDVWRRWKGQGCQPNFWQHVRPDPATSCGPYTPDALQPPSLPHAGSRSLSSSDTSGSGGSGGTDAAAAAQQGGWPLATGSHDTIAMVAITADGSVAAGASSNGAIHKVPGRVGDAAVPGGGAYADSCVGGCGSTGDGDTHLAFLPCFTVVELMRQGLSPREAAEEAVRRMARHRPGYVGAVVAAARDGRHGAAAYGWSFAYSVVSPATGAQVQVVQVPPLQLVDGPGRHGVPRV